ncbi:MAG: GSU2403 family nucleotidyltransferase fold protein [Caulobacteraceae bacterium]
MDFSELSLEQRRQLVDAQQLFAGWRPPAMEIATMGGLYWNTSKGKRYLYEKREGKLRSLGRETPALAKRKVQHDTRLKELRSRLRPLTKRIETMAPVNRAIGISRLPTIAAEILRELDSEGLLGSHIIVAGTNALYGYEIAAGTRVGGEHVATGDADLLWDTRQSLLLSATGVVRRQGLMSVLRRVDPSFTTAYGFNATNSRGYIVDLIVPEGDDFAQMRPNADVEAQPIGGVEWLIASPPFEQVIVGADGIPLRVVVPEPRTFALHKLWVSRRVDRNPLKKAKDAAHARIVANLAQTHLSLPLVSKEMPWLSPPLRKLIPELKTMVREHEA